MTSDQVEVYVDRSGFTWVDGVCEKTSMLLSVKEMPFREAKIGDSIGMPYTCSGYTKNSETTVQMTSNDFAEHPLVDGPTEEIDLDRVVQVCYKDFHKSDVIGRRLKFSQIQIGDVFSHERISPNNFVWQKISDTSAYPTPETRDDWFQKPYVWYIGPDEFVRQWEKRHARSV